MTLHLDSQKNNYVSNTLPRELYNQLNLLGRDSDLEKIINTVRLYFDLKGTRLGWSEKFFNQNYTIENITPKDVSQPVMWGLDSLKRIFLVFTYVIKSGKKSEKHCFTLFQEIKGGSGLRGSGTHEKMYLNPNDPNFCETLKELLTNQAHLIREGRRHKVIMAIK